MICLQVRLICNMGIKRKQSLDGGSEVKGCYFYSFEIWEQLLVT